MWSSGKQAGRVVEFLNPAWPARRICSLAIFPCMKKANGKNSYGHQRSYIIFSQISGAVSTKLLRVENPIGINHRSLNRKATTPARCKAYHVSSLPDGVLRSRIRSPDAIWAAKPNSLAQNQPVAGRCAVTGLAPRCYERQIKASYHHKREILVRVYKGNHTSWVLHLNSHRE